jgi:hypothetical protein
MRKNSVQTVNLYCIYRIVIVKLHHTIYVSKEHFISDDDDVEKIYTHDVGDNIT